MNALVLSWTSTIVRAIQLGEADAAYHITVAYVRRLREAGHLKYYL